eukprot:CAMPEP_0168624202 /NCGR_PEP_ID=MMETSP0449_2-20121227/9273_1 /TAXON_ID=1082188 /ORGANISM="Strombidium rassoulzadegani, Strain ras09" /LENGTH=40 /DNA_ID= /DNA_START= /DNA_END= /DNA_ORIENTATION=
MKDKVERSKLSHSDKRRGEEEVDIGQDTSELKRLTERQAL